MKICTTVLFNIMIASNIYASHNESDFIQKIPQYESQESLDSYNSEMKKRNKPLRNYNRVASPLKSYNRVASPLVKERVVLIIFSKFVSRVVISYQDKNEWISPKLDEKNEQYQKNEICFFKRSANRSDEYMVSIDNQGRKCMFPCGVTWNLFIDGNVFRYEKQVNDVSFVNSFER